MLLLLFTILIVSVAEAVLGVFVVMATRVVAMLSVDMVIATAVTLLTHSALLLR